MEVNIINKKNNPLLERDEVSFEVSFSGATPSFSEVRKEVVKKLKSKEKLTIIDSVEQRFGEHVARGYVKVYKNEQALKVEPEHRIKKNFEPKEPKPIEPVPAEGEAQAPAEDGEAKPEEKKDDAPADEKKEEAPAEEKKSDAPAEDKKKEDPVEDKKTDEPVKDDKPAEEEKGGE